VTSGIVSARGRLLPGARPSVPLIQTDASINPGNSGGPLFDLEGHVVGINTAIVIGARGIGFAVPIDIVKMALPQLERSGRIERSSAGLRLMRLPGSLKGSLGQHHGPAGALVREVIPGGPGDRSGVQPGDVIVRWDGAPVDDSDMLSTLMALTPPGTHVHVQLLRDGTPLARELEMVALPVVH
jgi:serine protease Do